jgi:hypothetical protein
VKSRRLSTTTACSFLLSAVLLGAPGCSDGGGDDDDDAGASGETSGGTGASGGSGGKGGSSGGKGGSSGGKGGSTSGGASGKGGSGTGGSGTGGSAGTPPDIDELPPADEADWTLFVYGHGDHNLSNSLLTDLREIAQADLGEPGSVNVLVLTDWDASQPIPGSDPPENFPEGIQLYRVPGGGADIELVAQGAEQSLDDPTVLSSVVADVFAAFPARRHGIILWDHGGAWSGGFGSDTQNGTVTRPGTMAVAAIPPALRSGLEAAGVESSPLLDFVAFDTCLMAGAEVAYPFRDLASTYIANAEIDYGAGWDYTATFSHFAANPDDDALDLAGAEVEAWDAHHAAASPNDALLRSHVALDTTRLEPLADASTALTDALRASTTFDPVDLGRAGFFALPPYASQFENAGSQQPGLRDLGQVADALSRSTSDDVVANAAGVLRAALDDLVVASSQGSLRAAAGQAGLHVELSLASQITPALASEYGDRAADWVDASRWNDVLDMLTGNADAVPPDFTHSVRNGDGATAAAPPVLEFATADDDAAKGAVYLGVPLDEQTLLLLGLVGSGTLEDAGAYEFAWDGTVAAFEDGQPASLDLWLDSGPGGGEPVLMIPGYLLGAAQDPLLTHLVLTPSEGAASAAVVSLGSVASTMSLAEIASAAPGATFVPIYYQVDATTGSVATASGNPMPIPESGSLALVPDYAPANTYVLLTTLTDVWGNSSSALDACVLAEPLGP